jgi:hypothetical protein
MDYKDWEVGNVVEDFGGNMQIVLFVDNNGTFKCMDSYGELNTYSCSCHTYKAKNVAEYYINKRDSIDKECETIMSLKDKIKYRDSIIEYLKEQIISLRTRF